MTKTKKRLLTIAIPVLLFAVSAPLFYFATVQYKKSFIELNSLKISKVELEKGNYSLYNITNEKAPNAHFDIEIAENKKLRHLKISVLQSKKSWFIGAASTVTLNDKKYQLLRDITISQNGLYSVAVANPEAIKVNLAIQNQSADSHFFKLILIYYGISVLSIIGLLIVLLIFLVKALREKKKNQHRKLFFKLL
ncbi:hypothetical protein [Flavobacterium gelatinilyticum]|uniref:hypothetical protein n=1 Tax=Flavobacterium gelatinilyticum TaxID=3003260 RepID=UPI00247FBD1E|nr:hypothetical protein [Flavobacterium gelatinilyticum]